MSSVRPTGSQLRGTTATNTITSVTSVSSKTAYQRCWKFNHNFSASLYLWKRYKAWLECLTLFNTECWFILIHHKRFLLFAKIFKRLVWDNTLFNSIIHVICIIRYLCTIIIFYINSRSTYFRQATIITVDSKYGIRRKG